MKQSEQSTYFSNGNLIIAGEYFVLTGAKALAVPLKYGQQMHVECFNSNSNTIQWETSEQGKSWFKAGYNCNNLDLKNSSDNEKALWIQKILKNIQKLKPELFRKDISYSVKCEIQFSTQWGWGSSSTLILNLANWAGIDPFDLNNKVTSGSGYDIAASGSPAPIFYRTGMKSIEINRVVFNPVFREFIHFIYLGKKQDSAASIEINLNSVLKNKKMIPVITALTERIAQEGNIKEFMRYITDHEKIISKTINIVPIKEKYFSDFEGEIKSLGAWGGDFAMAVSPLNAKMVKNYFKLKGLEIVFGFDEIVKN